MTELARHKTIEVIARNSSFRYRGNDTDVRQIGDELGVHYVLEGSQQKNGDRLKVTVQLIDTSDGTHIWAHSYDQEIGDLFTVQDQIIRTVADRVGVRIERLVPGYDPDRVTAQHLYLQALELVYTDLNEEVAAKSFELNQRALEADPDAAYGYVGVGHGYRVASVFGWFDMESKEALDNALDMALKALELEPGWYEVHYLLGRVYQEMGKQEEASAAYEKALELNPSHSRLLVGSTVPMLYSGDVEEAIKRLEKAKGLDPFHDDGLHWQMGWALWQIDDCEGALDAMMSMKTQRRASKRMLAGIYACLGQVEKAQEAYQVFYAEAAEPTLAEHRKEWERWTAPGALDRWLDHMRIAGMKD